MRHPYMLPDVSVIDPELTLSMPPDVTAHTGLDALTQCVEPYVSNSANPLTDAISLEGIKAGARSLRRACENGDDLNAREDMCLCSYYGGLSLANAKLGAVPASAALWVVSCTRPTAPSAPRCCPTAAR